MSETLGRIAGFEFVGLPSLPVWTAGVVAALLLVACYFSFSHAGRADRIGLASRVALILVGSVAAFLAVEAWSRLDCAVSGASSMHARKSCSCGPRRLARHSPVLILSWATSSNPRCEKAVFQSPEATAAALSYVAAELTLLADFTVMPARPAPTLRLRLAIFAAQSRATALAWSRACWRSATVARRVTVRSLRC